MKRGNGRDEGKEKKGERKRGENTEMRAEEEGMEMVMRE